MKNIGLKSIAVMALLGQVDKTTAMQVNGASQGNSTSATLAAPVQSAPSTNNTQPAKLSKPAEKNKAAKANKTKKANKTSLSDVKK